MDTIFMNSKNSRTSGPHGLLLNLALSNLNIYYTRKNIRKSQNNNKFKISAPTWNEEFELPDGSYSLSGITKLCTHLHPASSTSNQLHPDPSTSTQLILTSTQLISVSTQLSQRHQNQNIALWHVIGQSPQIQPKKNGVLEVLIPNPNFF